MTNLRLRCPIHKTLATRTHRGDVPRLFLLKRRWVSGAGYCAECKRWYMTTIPRGIRWGAAVAQISNRKELAA